jgi:release factor glutamine methyltransferase
MPSVHARVAAARQRLRAVGIPPDEADLDARLLAQQLRGWDAAGFFANAGEPEPVGFAASYESLVTRRAAREPLAYITGRQEFWGLTFEVSPAVLIPRPETELVVEVALDLFPDPSRPMTIADACAGCGCLAVALACERPYARVVATELSERALAVAGRNAVAHRVDTRVKFVCCDILEAVAGPFDLIVSNPPYVADSDRPSLQPEVRDHEPAVALFAGPDGLAVVRRLLAGAPARLTAGGALVFEFGFGQADAISTLISTTPGLTLVGLRPDLQGIPRVAILKRVRASDLS